MISRFLTLTLLFALTAFSQEPAGKSSPQPDQFTFEAVDLVRSEKSGHYFIPVIIEGKEFRFVVDSGSGYGLVLSEQTAKVLQASSVDAGQAGAVAGKVKSSLTTVGEFIVKGTSRRTKDIQAYVIPLGEPIIVDGKEVPMAGLVGAPLLDKWNAVIDTRGHRMFLPEEGTPADSFLRGKSNDRHVIAPLTKGKFSFAFADIAINEQSSTFLLDVGAGTNSLEPKIQADQKLEVIKSGISFGGAGSQKLSNIDAVRAERPVIAGKLRLPTMVFTVHSLQGTVPVPEGKQLGGLLGVKSLASMGAFVDFGSYTIIVPKRIRLDNLKRVPQ